MAIRTINIFARTDVQVKHASGGDPRNGDVIANALNGDAFSWENPEDLKITIPAATTTLTFEDSDGSLSDDPFAGSEVKDQFLKEPVTINGVTYEPSEETTRWKGDPPVNVENEYEVTLYSDDGTAYRMVGISITEGYTTTVVGVMFDGAQPPPGTVLTYKQGNNTYANNQSMEIVDSGPVDGEDDAPCFLAGTLIETSEGPRRVEDLCMGDRILTMDHGLRRLRWIGSSLAHAAGPLAPIRIEAGALGNRRALLVSPNHRILLRSPMAELYYGSPEVLVPAKALVDGAGIRAVPMRQARYFHLMFAQHEIVFAEGVASESLFAGAMALAAFDAATRVELYARFPDLEDEAGLLCRPGLSLTEARVQLAFGEGARPQAVVLEAPRVRRLDRAA
ncbi:MAG: Hint domain-containing protein [Pseudooceanicola nanhaiensis]